MGGAKFLHKTIDISDGVMGIETTLEGVPVAIIAGPLMDASIRMDD